MLNSYLQRIGYQGPTDPTLAVFRAVHRAHATTIAYENLDVQALRPVDQNIDNIVQKLVTNKRGGWCYEMNGLLGWALAELGFSVTRLCGGVMREAHGDGAFGNHLLLRVDLPEPWIADVGIGDGVREPFRLRPGPFQQGAYSYQLTHQDDGSWRFSNREGGLPPSFDFFDRPADEALLAQTCANLQSDAESMFRQNLIAQRMTDDGVHLLLGKVYTNPLGERTLLANAEQLQHCLEDKFAINNPPVVGLWEGVVARHTALFGNTEVDDIVFGPPPPEDD